MPFKYAVQIAYMGGGYSGWQRQADAVGVQEVIEGALAHLSREPVRIIGAGRTDKGVHALGQVASFCMDKDWDPDRLRMAMNFYLPEDVRAIRVYRVPDSFDARRSALRREYKYFIWHGWVCPPHMNGMVWWRKAKWDTDTARRACRMLTGRHDFRAFCKTGECPEDSVRDIEAVRMKRMGAMTVLTVRAPSFLMNMVRIMTGNIDAVARGEMPLEWLESLLSGGERDESAMTAPACGLWFWRASYRELPNLPPLGGAGDFFGASPNNRSEAAELKIKN